jgi:hypothetical protein
MMDNYDRIQQRKIALVPLIRTDGIEAVVWQDKDQRSHTLTKRPRSPESFGERLQEHSGQRLFEALVDAPADQQWVQIAEVAFRIQEAASVFGTPRVDLYLGERRARVETTEGGTRLLVVVQSGHRTIKSFSRIVRRGVTRIEKDDRKQPRPEVAQENVL